MDRPAAMETFVTVVDAGSFSAAARRLKLGQPLSPSRLRNWKRISAHGFCFAQPEV
jgi:hypothetical protein